MLNLLELEDGLWVNVNKITYVVDDLYVGDEKKRCWIHFGDAKDDIGDEDDTGLPLNMWGCELEQLIRECSE